MWQDIPLIALARELGALVILLVAILGVAALLGFLLSKFRR